MYKPLTYRQTQQSAYAYFHSNGISIARWSEALGIPYQAVRDVLSGRAKGTYGNSHKAAVALGLKPAPTQQ